MNSIYSQLFNNTKFKKIMSTEALKLRDEIYSLCFSHIHPDDQKKLHDHISETYNRINWEIPTLYQNNEIILEAVLRKTSKKFNDKNETKDTENWKRGTVALGAARRKDIDWFKLATFDDYEFWIDMIDVPRKIHVHPANVIIDSFTSMYNTITDWLFINFNFTSLYHIYEFSRDYSLNFIKDCMDKIDDPHKHTTNYLRAVINSEVAINDSILAEDKELTESSKKLILHLNSLLKKDVNVNWDEIEKKSNIKEENDIEFKKVILS